MKRHRQRRSLEEKRRIVAGYERSGLSQKEYAGRVGIGMSTLSLWRRQERGGRWSSLVEVEVRGRHEAVVEKGFYRLTLPCGVGVEMGRGVDLRELKGLLAVVREAF